MDDTLSNYIFDPKQNHIVSHDTLSLEKSADIIFSVLKSLCAGGKTPELKRGASGKHIELYRDIKLENIYIQL